MGGMQWVKVGVRNVKVRVRANVRDSGLGLWVRCSC